jgi:hypothetical protein
MRYLFNILAFAAGVYSSSTGFVDSNTGIEFQQYADATGLRFGIAVPSTVGSDFIALQRFESDDNISRKERLPSTY